MSSYKHNKTWRKKHPHKSRLIKKRYYKQFEENAYNKDQRWSFYDKAIVMSKFSTDRILSKRLGRSVKAIQIKRSRLNKIFPS